MPKEGAIETDDDEMPLRVGTSRNCRAGQDIGPLIRLIGSLDANMCFSQTTNARVVKSKYMFMRSALMHSSCLESLRP